MQMGCFIDNRFVGVKNGKETILINPVTEVELARLPCGGDDEVDACCKAAHEAFISSAWSLMPAAARGALLSRLADLIERDRDTIALLESANVGKPFFESHGFDLAQVIRSFRYFAGWADKNHGLQVPLNSSHLCFTTNVPLGPCALVMPFNFPLQLLCWKLAPALCVGCTIVIKPAEITPLSTLYLARLIREAGFPAGVVSVVLGKGREVGMTLLSHPLIEKVSFTGSVPVGCLVQQEAAKTGTTPKPCTLELGGKSPIIVFSDVADLDKCVTDSYHALFWNAGQCCSAASRIFVQDAIYDVFVEKMKTMVAGRTLGDPLVEGVMQGPQVSKAQMDSVLSFIEIGKKEGANLVCGGKRHGDKGWFIEPTIFSNVTNTMRIAREEIFGPVMSLIRFSTPEEALQQANDSDFGLVGAVYSADINRALSISQRIRAGTVWVNTFNVIDASLPWGGFKASGHGRDQSLYCLSMFTAPRATIINYPYAL